MDTAEISYTNYSYRDTPFPDDVLRLVYVIKTFNIKRTGKKKCMFLADALHVSMSEVITSKLPWMFNTFSGKLIYKLKKLKPSRSCKVATSYPYFGDHVNDF